MKDKKKDNLTVANIISCLGLVILFICTFLGRYYKTGGEMGGSIISALLITMLAAFFLWLMIKAKGAENQLEKWKKIEIAALILYLITVVPLSYFGMKHFFVVNSQKEKIKRSADNDLAKIDNMFTEYEKLKSEVSNIATQINNALDGKGNGKSLDKNLEDFLEKELNLKKYQNTKEKIAFKKLVKTWEENKDTLLFGPIYNDLKKGKEDRKAEISHAVENWNILKIPEQAKAIEGLATDMEKGLNSLAQKVKWPIIKENTERTFEIENDREIKFKAPEMEFIGAITGAKETSPATIALVLGIALIVNILVLFNYFVGNRTRVLRIGANKEEDGGMEL